ncbi:unnamed protein product [Rhizoctonia solani]|uniref:C2H2-type domain-containing protein n=1 Tax=Rhizoctonia solani TaxID=456999 RepID=A0A8H3HJE3_9AGAM|nr:unnamed protein product [Rhizoctonia solani]
MHYNGQVGEQSFAQSASSDATDVVGYSDLSYWVDEAQLELLDPALGAFSGAHLPSLSQWDPLLEYCNDYPPLLQPSYSSSNGGQAATMAYSAQQYDNQVNKCTPCYASFNEEDGATSTASFPSNLPEPSLYELPPPQESLVAPSPGEIQCLQNQYGQSYLDQNQVSTHNALKDWECFDMLMYYSTGVPIQAPENMHAPIEPFRMHLTDPTFPFKTGVEIGEVTAVQEQLASSSSTTVEQFPSSSPTRFSRGHKRKLSRYETPNTIQLEGPTMRDEYKHVLEQCWKYCTVLKDKRIMCRCAQVPELRLAVEKCKGIYKGTHEWKRRHNPEPVICDKCGKTFKRKDVMLKHRKQYCLETRHA